MAMLHCYNLFILSNQPWTKTIAKSIHRQLKLFAFLLTTITKKHKFFCRLNVCFTINSSTLYNVHDFELFLSNESKTIKMIKRNTELRTVYSFGFFIENFLSQTPNHGLWLNIVYSLFISYKFFENVCMELFIKLMTKFLIILCSSFDKKMICFFF